MHLLIFEPSLGGHHLSLLRYLTEDLLLANHRLTLCVDGREPAMEMYRDHLSDLLGEVAVVSAYDSNGRVKGSTKLTALDVCFTQSGADHAFVNNLDEFASSMFRRAAVGRLPPRQLKGKLSGIYFRPRFLANPIWPMGNLPKQIGFDRLAKGGWFHRICLMDEYLFARHHQHYDLAGLTFLPDPWCASFGMPAPQAREKLGIPAEKLVLLQYGTGTRRKGLHLAIQAILSPECPDHWHLLCAGQMADDREMAGGLQTLAEKGKATVLNRYVTKAEEAICFDASDIVLLPYVHHFGSSGVLALSAAAGKMVVASDYGLVARRVREHHLGLCFQTGSFQALRNAMAEAEAMLRTDPNRFSAAARRYASQCDRQAFRDVVTALYDDASRKTRSQSVDAHQR